MPPLSPPDFSDERHYLRIHEVAADDLVSGDVFPDANEEWCFGVGNEAATGHRL